MASFLKKVAKKAVAAQISVTPKPQAPAINLKVLGKKKLEQRATQIKVVRGLTGAPIVSSSSSSGSESRSGSDSNLDKDDSSTEEGGRKEGEDEEPAEKDSDNFSPNTIRRIRAQLTTVEHILLSGDHLEFGSDSDVSDGSHEYGDELVVEKGTKLVKWNPLWQRLSQPVGERSAKQRQIIKIKRIRQTKNARGEKQSSKSEAIEPSVVEQQAPAPEEDPADTGMTFVPTGPGKGRGKGVYYLEFSDDFRKSLKKGRDDLERVKGMSNLQKLETDWLLMMKSDQRSLQQKMSVLKASVVNSENKLGNEMFKLDELSAPVASRSISPRRRISPAGSPKSSRVGSPSRQPKPEEPQLGFKAPTVTAPLGTILTSQKGSASKPGSVSKKSATSKDHSHDAMGTMWPKTLWDNTESYWRMIMSEENFVITPSNYNRQQEFEFRQKKIPVDYSQLTNAKTKCLHWIKSNNEYFTL